MCNKKITTLLVVVLLILSACGQRGALYNPQTEPAQTVPSETESVPPAQAPIKTTSSMSEGV